MADNKEKSQEEYDRLVDDKRSAESREQAASHTRAALQDKVDRLKEVKEELGRCHDSFADVRSAAQSDINGGYAWRGANYDRFSSTGSDLCSANDKYYDNIDRARDAINTEMARLENEIYRQDGILGELRALINSLVHKIENFFN